MEEEKIKKLIYNYQSGQCSDEEKQLLEAWYDKQLEKVSNHVPEQQLRDDLAAIYKRLPPKESKRPAFSWLSIAASMFVLLSLSIGLYFYSVNHLKVVPQVSEARDQRDVVPELGKTFLTLADGRRISVTAAQTGTIAIQQGIRISKLADNMITYTAVADGNSEAGSQVLNVLTTSKGSQCQVKLPDGTKIWINAETALKFPTHFSGKKRLVELEGEAYFEVAKNSSFPFEVLTRLQEVQVLGTHFNVSSYSDEVATKTTLLEGKVKIVERRGKNNTILKPGEQSVLKEKAKIKVDEVDVDDAVAWRTGLFQFENSDLGQVTRQLARWYNVKFEFSGKIPDVKLWGAFHRNDRVEKALELLTFFDLDYSVVNKDGTKTVVITIKK